MDVKTAMFAFGFIWRLGEPNTPCLRKTFFPNDYLTQYNHFNFDSIILFLLYGKIKI